MIVDPSLRNDEVLWEEEETETDEWAMKLEPGTNPQEIADRHGHELCAHGNLEGIYLFKQKPGTIHGVTHPHHHESKEICWMEKQVARRREKRGFQDPLFPVQWHLHGSPNEFTVNAEDAWAQEITGLGVNIAIVDDGIEYNHPDLADNYKKELGYDYNYGDADPFPDSTRDDHGTSAAGVAAAKDNSVCGVGSAYRAGLSAIRLLAKSSTDFQEAGSLSHKPDGNHIYSNSWGPIDDGRRKEGPGKLASDAIESGILYGRSKLGSLYVWACGNGRRSRDNCNYDGWANSRYTITIAAIDYSGEQAWYSEPCSMLIVTAPSSGYGSKSIFTTDLLGSRGTSRDDCTSTFGGTSAAAPLAAGVVALIVEANGNLTWREVQGVLIESAKSHREHDVSWQTNGGGKKYSHGFGFGLIDAGNAVRIAKSWKHFGEYLNITVTATISEPILKSNEWVTVGIPVSAEPKFVVEHVELVFLATHPRRGDLEITLLSPFGTYSNLAETHGDSGANYNWKFGSIVCWGENPNGTWKLKVRDTKGSGGTITGYTLRVFGHLQ